MIEQYRLSLNMRCEQWNVSLTDALDWLAVCLPACFACLLDAATATTAACRESRTNNIIINISSIQEEVVASQTKWERTNRSAFIISIQSMWVVCVCSAARSCAAALSSSTTDRRCIRCVSSTRLLVPLLAASTATVRHQQNQRELQCCWLLCGWVVAEAPSVRATILTKSTDDAHTESRAQYIAIIFYQWRQVLMGRGGRKEGEQGIGRVHNKVHSEDIWNGIA